MGTHWYELLTDGKPQADQIEEIADIATGTIPARQNEEEIILYSAGGMPVEDVAWATDMFRTAVEKRRYPTESLGVTGTVVVGKQSGLHRKPTETIELRIRSKHCNR